MENYETICQKLVGSLIRGGHLTEVPTGFTLYVT